MISMAARSVKQYLSFIAAHRSAYIRFNKQLIIGELAGFGAGIATAEIAASSGLGQIEISAYSSLADYAGSVAGFLAIYHDDQKASFANLKGFPKIRAVFSSALKLWPSVLAADIAFVLSRPYMHYVSMSMGLEPGLAAGLAHFLAFGVFNIVAVISKSLIDYARQSRISHP